MLESVFNAGTFSILSVCMALGAALLLGLVIAMAFKFTDTSGSNLAMILVVLPVLVAAVIMIVNGSLGTSVAVLGAFGLVRFRSAPGSAKEIAYIFFSMAVGLALGMGYISLGFMITALVLAVLVLLEKIGFSDNGSSERDLKVTIPEDLSYNGIFDDLFLQYTSKSNLRRVKTTNMGTMYELTYRVVMRQPEFDKELIDAIRCRNGNLSISLGLVQKEKNEL